MGNNKIKIYQPKLAPSYPHPLTGDLATICINREWLPLLQGLLHPLRWKSAIWQGTPEEVDTMHQYIEDLLAVLGDDENCAMACDKISDLRIYQGKLQKKLCGSDVWQNVGRINPIVNYNNNMLQLDLDGDDIIDVSFGPNPTDIPSEPAEPRNYGHICAGVNGLLDWMTSLYKSSLDEIEQMINEVATAADTILAIVTLGQGEITPVDNLIHFAQAMSLSLLQAQRYQLNDPVYQEGIRCSLYCLLKVNDGGLTQAVFDEWLETIPDWDILLIDNGWAENIVEFFLFEAIQKRYNIYSLNINATCEPICDECQDLWTQEFDFAPQSFSDFFSDYEPFSQTSSVWEMDNGWESRTVVLTDPDPDQNALLNYLLCNPETTFNIQHIEVSYIINGWAGNENMTSEPLGIRQEVEGALESIGGSFSAFTNGSGLFIFTWDGNADVSKLIWSFYGGFKYAPTAPAGTFAYRKIVISGGGTNPFA